MLPSKDFKEFKIATTTFKSFPSFSTQSPKLSTTNVVRLLILDVSPEP